MLTPITDTTVNILFSLYAIVIIVGFILYSIESGISIFKDNAK